MYLDQVHWIYIARQQKAPELLPALEREAAASLVRLARERRVVLPFAAAHLTELPRRAGQRHRDLASVILGVSRGWHMRNPLRVRQKEYSASMLGMEPRAADVFTLEPGTIFGEGPDPPEPAAGVPPDWAELTSRIMAASAVYSAVLDDPPDMRDARAAATRWAEAFPPLASCMREMRMGARQARINARGRFIADQTQDLANAAKAAQISEPRFQQWLEGSLAGELGRMPYAGRLAEVIYIRLRNADEKWEAKDLNDMNFLCAAAGYADVTVGEKQTVDHLRRAERVTVPGSQLCRRLSDAVELLAARGVAL